MSETITTTQLLEFLEKAQKVSSHVTVNKVSRYSDGEYVDYFYEIAVNCDWDENNHFYTQNTSITTEGKSNPFDADYEFFTMSSMLDYLVEKEEEKEMKRRKRQELLSRLTDEEKELLGVK